MASTARTLILSSKLYPPPSFGRRYFLALPTISTVTPRRGSEFPVICCLVSGVGGGGASDTTRNSEFSREFAVIANMLRRIEPLDTSVVSKGVSDSAKDSMKQTISTMLGLLPSDQFSVSVRLSKLPLHRLLVSAIITGYTLWNAEYRISLRRNFELSLGDNLESCSSSEGYKAVELGWEEDRSGVAETSGEYAIGEGMERSDSINGVSPKALSYMQQLESELSAIKLELDVQKRELLEMESDRGNSNNLLEYLRSLESEMIAELSQPSSTEVKEVIHQLSQNILQTFFRVDGTCSEYNGDKGICDHQETVNENGEFTTTSRDYLAKLLFWFYTLSTFMSFYHSCRFCWQIAQRGCLWCAGACFWAIICEAWRTDYI